MSTTTETHDLEELTIALASGRPVDPMLKQRIQERSQKIRDERFRKHGFLSVAVDLVREIRDE